VPFHNPNNPASILYLNTGRDLCILWDSEESFLGYVHPSHRALYERGGYEITATAVLIMAYNLRGL
jgi:hypothetical protein